MAMINRDSIVAFVLLLFCSTLYAATYDIRGLMIDASMGPEVWPRIVIGFMALLSLVYLIQSVRGRYVGTDVMRQPLADFLNPAACIACFAAFLLMLPYLGFFVGGLIFIFALLTILGTWSRRAVLTHLAISVVVIAIMWALFTHLLRMYLPQGTLVRLF